MFAFLCEEMAKKIGAVFFFFLEKLFMSNKTFHFHKEID